MCMYIVYLYVSVDKQWKGLVNAISGLMCTSLSSINSASTYQPAMSFRPQGAILGNYSLFSVLIPTALSTDLGIGLGIVSTL